MLLKIEKKKVTYWLRITIQWTVPYAISLSSWFMPIFSSKMKIFPNWKIDMRRPLIFILLKPSYFMVKWSFYDFADEIKFATSSLLKNEVSHKTLTWSLVKRNHKFGDGLSSYFQLVASFFIGRRIMICFMTISRCGYSRQENVEKGYDNASFQEVWSGEEGFSPSQH